MVWNIFFPHILGRIIPTDYFFCRGVETTNQLSIMFVYQRVVYPVGDPWSQVYLTHSLEKPFTLNFRLGPLVGVVQETKAGTGDLTKEW